MNIQFSFLNTLALVSIISVAVQNRRNNRDWEKKTPFIEEKKELSNVIKLLQKQDIISILNNTDHFWLIYCKIFAELMVFDASQTQPFLASLHDNTITVNGNEQLLNNLKIFIERLREFLLDSLTKKENLILNVIKDRFLGYCICKDDNEVSTNKNGLVVISGKVFYNVNFEKYIEPILPLLLSNLNGNCLCSIKEQKDNGVEYTTSIKIEWSTQAFYSYHIIPLPVNCSAKSESLCEEYRKQEKCDFSLVVREKQIKCHSSILKLSGDFFTALFHSKMKESNNMQLTIEDYDEVIVKHFLDFIYYGENKLIQNYLQKSFNLVELFHFANQIMMTSFIDCCTNLFAMFTTDKDLESIQTLADFYQNSHLEELAKFFQEKDESGKIIIKP